MASKIFVFFALACAVQGLNGAVIRPSFQAEQSFGINLYKEALGYFEDLQKEYSNIVGNFENVFDTEVQGPGAEFAGSFGDILNTLEKFAESGMGFQGGVEDKGLNMGVIRKCIKEQEPNFRRLVEQTKMQIAKARVELRQFIFDTLTPYAIAAREALRALGDEIAQFPIKIWQCIQDLDILKAMEVIQNTRKVITEKAKEIARNLTEARAKFPEIRDKAKQMGEEIMKEARAGMETITNAVRQCIANGGPKGIFLPHSEQVDTLIAPARFVRNA